MKSIHLLSVVVLLSIPAPPLLANEAQERPELRAVRATLDPVIDGDVVNDPAWRAAAPATGFVQTTPDEGEAASEKTEVFVLASDTTLYIGVVCWDRNPDAIIIADSRRDASLDDTDSFQVILDTYHDLQNGFVFGTNAAGIEFDGQVDKEGGGFNLNWDGSWTVKAQVFDRGWSAEMAIPFTTLRYPKKQDQVWGINFQRNIRRRNERAFWSPLQRQYGLHRLSMAGTLAALEISKQRNLTLIPYLLGSLEKRGSHGSTESDFEAGLDLKLSLTPSLTLDATYNTDFAQVEADEQQINLDRFNLFFPEKRAFFLENAGLFTVGSPGEVELFFSRRIGIGPGGALIPIRGGVRVSGKMAGTNVGLLLMETDDVQGAAPVNDFAVMRVSRELPNRSSLGAIVVGRRGRGGVIDDDDNLTYAVDGRLGLGRYGALSAYVAGTDTPGVTTKEHAFNLSAEYDSPGWLMFLKYTEVGEGFNPEVGFLSRRGYRRPQALIYRRIRPTGFLGLHEIRPHVSYSGHWDFDGYQESGFLHIDSHWEWPSGAQIHTGVNYIREGVKEPFEISPGIVVPIGTYDNSEVALVFLSNQGAAVSGGLRVTVGGFFGGDRLALVPSMNFRIGETFNGEVSLSHNDVDLPQGAFDTNLGRLRVSYSFSPKMMLQALVQYNDRSHLWSSNLRFSWLHRANTGLFIVYNDGRAINGSDLVVPDKSLVIKLSRMFDVLR